MSNQILNGRVIQRNDTSANWASINPILLKGEMGVESDTKKFKFGDGTTAWNSLEYAMSGGLEIATQAEAEAGVVDDKAMTPLKTKEAIEKFILEIAYPVGSLYWSSKPTNPEILLGGTWVQIKDTFILAAGDNYAAGSYGGSATETLTLAQIPEHDHFGSAENAGNHFHQLYAYADASGGGGKGYWFDRRGALDTTKEAGTHSHNIYITKTGGGQSHNNMPPYTVKYCWERTA